ncbi:GNAT family N-acetyltransferase [Thermococcus sp.]
MIERDWNVIHVKNEGQLIGAPIFKHLPQSNSVVVVYIIVHRGFRGSGFGTLLRR